MKSCCHLNAWRLSLLHRSVWAGALSIVFTLVASPMVLSAADADESTPATANPAAPSTVDEIPEEPWDYSPYRVLIWVASRDASFSAQTLRKPLHEYLDRDFFSIWRLQIEEAPPAIATAAHRSIGDLTFDRIAASDPVIAVKKDHDDAIRIQSVRTLAEYVSAVPVTEGTQAEVIRRATEAGDPSLGGAVSKLKPFGGDALALAETWKDPETEALLVTRGQANTFDEPKAKILSLPISGLISTAVEKYDKIFVVRIDDNANGSNVSVVEMETLMRLFGGVVTEPFQSSADLPSVIGHAVTTAFSPMVRIDEAGQKTATGMVRAANLITDPESPARVTKGRVLQPMIRKNDRNGRPISLGRIEWAYLISTEIDGPYVEMDYYTGRPGGLQGRKNKRTFKMAMLMKPRFESTLLRLHVKDRTDLPLIGYELYERTLKSKTMTFVGRTDWNGRLDIEKTDNPMRLLYVKNGGAVLARLPLVPGLTANEVADLTGDDMRLQAEAYVRGAQNAIVDLVAIRKLLAARIRMRLRKGQMKEAEELIVALRDQPTQEELANDMDKKQGYFLDEIGNRNIGQRKKVDDMFKLTREMLGKQINPAVIRGLEADFNRAKANGGKLPPEEEKGQP